MQTVGRAGWCHTPPGRAYSQVAEVTETDDSTLSADDEEDPPLSPAVA